jgi:uncharacterized protein YcfJ
MDRMRNSQLLALASAAVAVALAGCENGIADGPGYATVLDVRPITEVVETPREVCEDRVVERRLEERDGEAGGAIAGAVIGGLLGNQVGSGSGRKAATVAGAVAGGFAGKEIDERHEGGKVVADTVRDCRTVTDATEVTVAYEVEYEYDGAIRTTRMAEAPTSNRIAVREALVLEGDD